VEREAAEIEKKKLEERAAQIERERLAAVAEAELLKSQQLAADVRSIFVVIISSSNSIIIIFIMFIIISIIM
jgi:hypothetical protein